MRRRPASSRQVVEPRLSRRGAVLFRQLIPLAGLVFVDRAGHARPAEVANHDLRFGTALLRRTTAPFERLFGIPSQRPAL